MTSDLPIFSSAHQALMFAYSYSAHQHAVAAAAERAIAMHGKERYREVQARVESRGLSGVYGAAQAGMIRAQVERLPRSMKRVIEARFAFMEPDLQRRAMQELVFGLSHVEARNIPFGLLSILVQRHYGADVKFVPLAEKYGVERRDLLRSWSMIRRRLSAVDHLALSRLEIEFEQHGICEHI